MNKPCKMNTTHISEDNISAKWSGLLKMIRVFSLLAAICLPAFGAKAEDKVSLMPEIHGALRPRYELDTKTGDGRFAVRWARFVVEGMLSPHFGYFVQTDFCDQGTIRVLDAFAKIKPAKNLMITAGQFPVPIGTEITMSPHTYIFANRSFIAKQVCNYRKQGVKAAYTFPFATPLTLEASIYNAHGGPGQPMKWSKHYAGSGKATLKAGDFEIFGGVMDARPDAARIMYYDGGVNFQNANWRARAEYINEHYVASPRKDANTWVVWGDYGHDAKLGIFNRWSVQARYDGMTRQWSGMEGEEDNPARQRLTVGGTLSYRYKWVHADLILDYEKSWYHHDVLIPEGQGDKVVMELVVKF